MRSEEFVTELNIDNKTGWGQTPNNQEIDYFGIKVLMKPSTFLSLAATLNVDDIARGKIDAMKAHHASGGTFAAPTLYIRVDDAWKEGKFTGVPEVIMHEGRHRMNVQLETEGDVPLETHILLRSEHGEWRARNTTPELLKHLNLTIRAESKSGYGIKRTGPFFTMR